jgi:hypothetical protein
MKTAVDKGGRARVGTVNARLLVMTSHYLSEPAALHCRLWLGERPCREERAKPASADLARSRRSTLADAGGIK